LFWRNVLVFPSAAAVVTAGGGGGGDSASFFGEQVSQYKELAARLDAFSSSAAGFFSFQASNEEKTRVA
jgi:hypothetical protein